jgi:ATP-dependent DNA ligase
MSAFGLMALDGDDLQKKPFLERKAALAQSSHPVLMASSQRSSKAPAATRAAEGRF